MKSLPSNDTFKKKKCSKLSYIFQSQVVVHQGGGPLSQTKFRKFWTLFCDYGYFLASIFCFCLLKMLKNDCCWHREISKKLKNTVFLAFYHFLMHLSSVNLYTDKFLLFLCITLPSGICMKLHKNGKILNVLILSTKNYKTETKFHKELQ